MNIRLSPTIVNSYSPLYEGHPISAIKSVNEIENVNVAGSGGLFKSKAERDGDRYGIKNSETNNKIILTIIIYLLLQERVCLSSYPDFPSLNA